MTTVFEKITKDKETLAKYLYPIRGANETTNEAICSFCSILSVDCECCELGCFGAVIKWLDSDV